MVYKRNFEIFRPGTFTCSDGREITFTEQQLREAAEYYDPNIWLAPLTIGHRKDNKPHLGDVEAVYMYKGRLHVAAKIEDELFENVKNNKYKNRSASFFLPDSPGNPTPGKLSLRHVGFLGAVPPAVKGLAPLNFSSGAESAPVDFATTLTPIYFLDKNVCDTSVNISVKQANGNNKQAFLWHGKLLFRA